MTNYIDTNTRTIAMILCLPLSAVIEHNKASSDLLPIALGLCALGVAAVGIIDDHIFNVQQTILKTGEDASINSHQYKVPVAGESSSEYFHEHTE